MNATPTRSSRGQRGQVMILAALALVGLVGMAGLAADYGMGAIAQRTEQNAADAAALGAAYQIGVSSNESTATSTAQSIAQQYGYQTSELTLSFLDSSGNVTANGGSVATAKATVTHATPTLFIRVVGINTQTESASGAASVWAGTAPCAICLLNGSGTDLTLSGSGSAAATGGGISVDSSSSSAASISGSGSVTAPSIGVVGSTSDTGSGRFTPAATTISTFPDPLAKIPAPKAGDCPAETSSVGGSVSLSGSTSASISPGAYNGISVSGSGSLTLAPGLYCMTGGGISDSGSGSLNGSGVTMYFTCGTYTGPAACSCPQVGGDGGLSLTGSGSYTITAPSSGTYQGLSIFYDRCNGSDLTITGSGSDSYTGTIYAKLAKATLSGSGSATPAYKSLIVVGSLKISGSGTARVSYDKSQNDQDIGMPALTQ